MAFKDILVTLTSYPEPSPSSVVDDAVSIAAVLGAHLAALSCETHVQVPGHFLSGSFANLPGIIAGEGAKSRHNAQTLLAAFEKAAERAGVPHEAILQKCTPTEVPNLLVDYARLHDLTIMPVPESDDQMYAEAVIFGSGKTYPGLAKNSAVAPVRARNRSLWLGISAALPPVRYRTLFRFLKKRERSMWSQLSMKRTWTQSIPPKQLAKNLARHEIDVVLERIEAKGKPIGSVLESYTLSHGVDLLVMGAYGHSRLRQFILGGATKSLLSKPSAADPLFALTTNLVSAIIARQPY